MLHAEKIREDFPILNREINGHLLIYLDNTATSQKPRQVIDAISNYYENNNANIHRGVHTLSNEASEMYDESKEKISEFIGSRSNEIIFTRNATESQNLIAYSWGLNNLKAGDEIIITKMEHHSNIVPWHILQKKLGIKIKTIDFGEDYSVSIDSLNELIGPKTKIVAVTELSNVLGIIVPVREICSIARDNGALSVVDGAQSAPHIPVDVKRMGCDFFSFSAHKMLGPTGIGVLYGKYELLEEMDPFFGGGGMIKDVTLEGTEYAKPPEKFEAGTPDIAGAVGFASAIDYLSKIGMEEVHDYEHVLNNIVIEKITEMNNVEFYGPRNPENRGSVYSFNIKGMNPHDVAMLFDQQGIALRSGKHCAHPLMYDLGIDGTVRASPYIYNTTEEVKKFLDVLEEISD